MDNIINQLMAEPHDRQTAKVIEVLVVAGKLHPGASIIRPGWCFVRRCLQLSGLPLNGERLAGGGDALGRWRENGKAERVVVLTPDVMVDGA